MKNSTREQFNQLNQRIATLNNVSTVAMTFSVEPSLQQTLENRIQESSEFLTRINIVGVDEMEGEKLGLGITGPIAGRTKVSQNNPRRPREVTSMDAGKYRCIQTEYDTAIKYAQLDMWAKFKDFQTRVRDLIVKRQALDRIMIGFNGITAAEQTDQAKYPLLQDVNTGWLQHYRKEAPARVMPETRNGKQAGKILIGSEGDYNNLDALVMDAVAGLIDPVYQGAPDLVVIVGRNMLHDKYFPIINQDHPPSEILAADIVTSQKRIGNLPAIAVPFFPDNAMLITPLSNLSIYYQIGARRRTLREEPDYNQIANYESSNDAYVVERYEAGCLVENITALPAPAAGKASA